MNKKFNGDLRFSGMKLRQRRESSGWTIGKFADELKKNHPKAAKSLIWRWEMQGVEPRLIYMRSICAILKCKDVDLME
jgi:transcriptional regulator with XRE-family HTH domain